MKKFITMLLILSFLNGLSQPSVKNSKTYQWDGKILTKKQMDDTLKVYFFKFCDSVKLVSQKK